MPSSPGKRLLAVMSACTSRSRDSSLQSAGITIRITAFGTLRASRSSSRVRASAVTENSADWLTIRSSTDGASENTTKPSGRASASVSQFAFAVGRNVVPFRSSVSTGTPASASPRDQVVVEHVGLEDADARVVEQRPELRGEPLVDLGVVDRPDDAVDVGSATGGEVGRDVRRVRPVDCSGRQPVVLGQRDELGADRDLAVLHLPAGVAGEPPQEVVLHVPRPERRRTAGGRSPASRRRRTARGRRTASGEGRCRRATRSGGGAAGAPPNPLHGTHGCQTGS